MENKLELMADPTWLRGKGYTFEDGIALEVVEVKRRDTGYWITYQTVYPGGGLPRRFGLTVNDFFGQYGHLFQRD